MADTTIPTTPVIPAAQDLQINLDDAPKAEEITIPENKGPELNLDLDLNLPEVPKNDDRLKTEDQKNTETVVETPVPEVVAEAPVVAAEPTLLETPVVEQTPVENKVEEMVLPEVVAEAPATEETSTPSTTVESEPITAEAPVELKEDMKMIDELEGHGSAGGLAEEAKVETQPAAIETPKTFDLDAMLGGPTTPPVIEATPAPVMEAVIPMPTVTATAPIMAPAFTLPTMATQAPVQAVMQTKIPQDKNKGVKMLLFVVMFMGLGFTTFFILKTMYPVEFGNLLGGGKVQIHAIENSTEIVQEVTGAVQEITGATQELSGTIETGTGTGDHESAPAAVDNAFGALNDLGTTTAAPEQNDVSRLTDYVTQGNNFLAQGKTMSNNTMIKYGLYITKKATTFLEKIANGEQINNLSGYFAQFDQYLTQLKELAGQTTTPDVAEPVSTTPPTNGIQGMNDTATEQITTTQ